MIEFPITLTSSGSVCLPGRAYALALGYTKNRGVYRLAVTASGEWEGLTVRAFWHVPDGKAPASSLVVDGYVAVPASVTAQPGSGCITFEGSDGAKVMTSADLRYRVSANSGTEDGTEPEPGTPAWQQLVDAVHTDATAVEQAKIDAQTAAQQAGASAKKAGHALSDTITAKEDALKAIGDKQTTATQAVDTARDKALQQVEASTEAAQTAASEAATSAGNASQSAQEAAGSLQELKDGIASGEFKGEPGTSPTVTVQDIAGGHRIVITDATGTSSVDVIDGKQGDPGKDATVDITLTHEGEAADAKATGDAISAVKARQNVLIGTETGNPLSVDDAFPAPLCGLTVYGKSTQSGTPTQDVPVPIVSAGDGGSLTVKVTGKNLLHLTDGSKTFRGVTIAAKDGLISISGTATETGYAVLDISPFITPGVLILSSSIKSPVAALVSQTWDGILFQNAAAKMSDTATRLVFTVDQGQTYNLTNVKLQLELGTTATAYSPYREQLLTLPTPNGLPGIPVTSGGNYTDSAGQQWVCDEVDLTRGVRVQRVNAVDLSTCKITGTTELAVTKRLSIMLPIRGRDYKTEALCNKLQFLVSFSNDTPHFYVDTSNAQVFIPIGAKNPEEGEYILLYVLATPIETPLTPAELSDYKALIAYAPDTVVQAGDGAGIKLDYQRDVNLVVKNLEDAIASMTTT